MIEPKKILDIVKTAIAAVVILMLSIAIGTIFSGCHTMQRELVSTRVDPETGAEIRETTTETSKVFDEGQLKLAAKAAQFGLSYYASAEKQKAEAKGAKFQFLRDWSTQQQDRHERLGDKWYERFQERGGSEALPGFSDALSAARDALKGED